MREADLLRQAGKDDVGAALYQVRAYPDAQICRIERCDSRAAYVRRVSTLTRRTICPREVADRLPAHGGPRPRRTHGLVQGRADVVLSCLPEKVGLAHTVELIKAGIKVIDLSADFRLKDPAQFARPTASIIPRRNSSRKRFTDSANSIARNFARHGWLRPPDAFRPARYSRCYR